MLRMYSRDDNSLVPKLSFSSSGGRGKKESLVSTVCVTQILGNRIPLKNTVVFVSNLIVYL